MTKFVIRKTEVIKGRSHSWLYGLAFTTREEAERKLEDLLRADNLLRYTYHIEEA